MDNVNKGITTYIVDGKEVGEDSYRLAQGAGRKAQGESSYAKASADRAERPKDKKESEESQGINKDKTPYDKK